MSSCAFIEVIEVTETHTLPCGVTQGVHPLCLCVSLSVFDSVFTKSGSVPNGTKERALNECRQRTNPLKGWSLGLGQRRSLGPVRAGRKEAGYESSTPRHGSSLRYNRRNMQFSVQSCTAVPSPWLPSKQLAPDLFWAADWPALWAMVRAECDVAPVYSTTRRTATEQKQARIRKVATQARSGEKGRALATARNAPPVHPTDPEPPAPAQAFVSNLFLSEVANLISSTLRKMPRLTEPGPLGMRAEHWYDFGAPDGNSNLFVQVAAHICSR